MHKWYISLAEEKNDRLFDLTYCIYFARNRAWADMWYRRHSRSDDDFANWTSTRTSLQDIQCTFPSWAKQISFVVFWRKTERTCNYLTQLVGGTGAPNVPNVWTICLWNLPWITAPTPVKIPSSDRPEAISSIISNSTLLWSGYFDRTWSSFSCVRIVPLTRKPWDKSWSRICARMMHWN